MKPIWNNINKLMSITYLVVGIFILMLYAYAMHQQIIFIEKIIEQQGFQKSNISYLKIFLNNLIPFALGSLLLTSGILMLYRKKLGWILGFSSLLMITYVLIPIAFYGINDITTTFIEDETSVYAQIMAGIGVLIGLIFMTMMSLKPIRIINQIKMNSCFLSFEIVLILFLIEKFL